MPIIKDIALLLCMCVLVCIAFYLGTRHWTLEDQMKHYDCRLAEFVPDFPPEVRAECRRRTIEWINQQREQQQR